MCKLGREQSTSKIWDELKPNVLEHLVAAVHDSDDANDLDAYANDSKV